MKNKKLESVNLILVDEPTEPGFYIIFNKNPWGESTRIIKINNGLNTATLYWIGDEQSISKEGFGIYKWIHIKIQKPQNNLPTESGIYWVWRDGCIANKMIVNFNAEGGYYKTIGKMASSSATNIREYNWQKVNEPNG